MQRLVRVVLALACVAMLTTVASCADMITGGPLLRPGEPTGTLQVFNRSRVTITAVLISRCSASSYGLNRLPSGVTIPPGRSYDFKLSAGCWDVDAGAYGIGEARQQLTVRAGGLMRYGVTGG